MMAARRTVDARAVAVLALGYLAGVIAYPSLPGPFLHQQLSMRILVAFTLPTTALVIFALSAVCGGTTRSAAATAPSSRPTTPSSCASCSSSSPCTPW